ncbi:DsbA family protein [Siccibacter turicensis]|uniref:DsbA family protein n=1 Tax=Siccibacter TaxID=1649298 RepID=UPI0004649A8C|nr:DsbA family protein [Siccibacter turicensis]
MLIKTVIATVVTTYIGFSSIALASTPAPVFTPEQEARIGELAEAYLLEHPEILVQVSQKLQAQQTARQQMGFALNVMEHQEALLNDPDTPVTGPKEAKVAVIEFFDYQCVFCSRLAPAMEDVMKASPDTRFVFKEWPIFAQRWENSQKAAERGVAIWKEKGAEAYLTYHSGIYHTGHSEGELTELDIKTASAAAGYTPVKQLVMTSALDKTNALAQALGLTGTPGLIVMPVKNATPEKITVFPGLATAEQILSAIDKASN